MKCSLCKYKNAALEAERHPNGITVFTAQALQKHLREDRRLRICVDHALQDIYSKDLEAGNKALAHALEKGYVPLGNIWYQPVWLPKGERQ